MSLLEFVRPSMPTGFSYEVTTAGLTGAREPKWVTALNATMQDGSVTFTCRAAGSNGINAISGVSAVSAPTGLTIGSISVSDSTKILATYSGGSEDNTYDVAYTFTLAGNTRVARQRVPVIKR